MTEQQMRERMKEIDKEREKLREEKTELENYFYNKKEQETLNDHKKYIGKCFVSKNKTGNINDYVKAFKVLDVLDYPQGRNALCLALIDGHRSAIFNEYGIEIITLGLWTPNTLRLMSTPTDPKVIDYYTEVTQEEFEVMYKVYMQKYICKS